jgi:hypothetical protein
MKCQEQMTIEFRERISRAMEEAIAKGEIEAKSTIETADVKT